MVTETIASSQLLFVYMVFMLVYLCEEGQGKDYRYNYDIAIGNKTTSTVDKRLNMMEWFCHFFSV